MGDREVPARLGALLVTCLSVPLWSCEAAAPHQDPPLPGLGPQLLATTTDFGTGAVSVIEPGVRAVQRDVALGSTDAIPFADLEHAYILHRFGLDYIDVLDRDDWSLESQHALQVPGVSSVNAHALAIGPDGLAYLGTYGAAALLIVDLAATPGASLLGGIDLSPIADADGIAEVELAAWLGGELWLAVERLDRSAGWLEVAPPLLILIDVQAGAPVDLDPDAAGTQGLELGLSWPRQWRDDPVQPGRQIILGDAILSFDPATRTVETLVTHAQFAAAGIESPLQPQAFCIDPSDGALIVAAYVAGFGEVRLHRFDRHGGPATVIAGGLDSVERTVEWVDGEIWVGSTRVGATGMWGLGPGGDALVDSPLSLGLPPYSVVALP